MKNFSIKKFGVLLCMAAVAITMVGCDARSIGFIGDKDGGTDLGVTDMKYRTEKEPVKAVMLDGSLYYEIGEDRDIEGNYGTLDGKFKKAVEEYEVPKNNNESNFKLGNEEYSGYRIGKNNDTIEVPIHDDWEIFKKLTDSEKDLTNYKYIVKVEGNTQYDFGEAEYIVLTNNLEITANDVAKSMMSEDSKDHIDIYVVEQDLD